MRYGVGVDIGTTYSAAAIHRDGRAEIVIFGHRSPTVPSVVLVTETETLVGEPALRRAIEKPEHLARHIKRRVGDDVPLILGGHPVAAESLMAHILRAVLGEVTEQQGEPPQRVVLTRPANWGPYKEERLRQVATLADVGNAVFLTEPEAAAIAYASTRDLGAGAVVAVYDLGGGTFDATVLRHDGKRFSILGSPQGIESLGGIDFDSAVFDHVARSLDGALERLDPSDPAVMHGLGDLRVRCVEAKEALSSDTQAAIRVALPELSATVRLTRAEFEHMIRPALQDTVGALQRAISAAGLEPAEVDRVLLVGGSSRIPLVGQTIASALQRPVALDAHPKHAVAIGAAIVTASRHPAAPGDRPLPPVTERRPHPVMRAAGPAPQQPPPRTPTPVVEHERQQQAPGRLRWVALPAVIVAGILVGALAARLTDGGQDNARTEDTPTSATSPTSDPTTSVGSTTSGSAPSATSSTSGSPASAATWVVYEDPDAGYSIAHPSAWQIDGAGDRRVTFSDPSTGASMLVEWTPDPGPDPVADWEELAPNFASQHEGYEEIQIAPYDYRDYEAAVWEFRYDDEDGTPVHAADLGFVTDGLGYALYFRTPEALWVESQETFAEFRRTFEP